MSKAPTEKKASTATVQRYRTEVRILKTEKALNDVLNDLDRVIEELKDREVYSKEEDFALTDLYDVRADLHGAMSHLRGS
jgi:hypothetical protein